MNKQTENYIALKPLADRFAEVSKSISDEDIKWIIKDTLRERISEELCSVEVPLEEIVSEWFEDETNVEWIVDTLRESIEKRLYNKESRW